MTETEEEASWRAFRKAHSNVRCIDCAYCHYDPGRFHEYVCYVTEMRDVRKLPISWKKVDEVTKWCSWYERKKANSANGKKDRRNKI